MCQLAAKFERPKVSDEEGWENDLEVCTNENFYIPSPIISWYYAIKYYLTHGISPHYVDLEKKRALRLKSA